MSADAGHFKDGYTELPRAKIAAIATSLEMLERPEPRPLAPGEALGVRQVLRPETGWYRDLFQRIGEPWLWHSRLRLAPPVLEAIIRSPDVEVWVVEEDGREEGLLELDFRRASECELAFFGLTGALIGRGAGRRLMEHAIARAWSRPIRRFWVHTCTLDHPAALAFYVRSGFRPYKRMLEIADDPRLDGTLPRDAAPGVPILA
jgi:GNAT superfamily N-acetyltransferase